MIQELYQDKEAISAADSQEWRAWLKKNHKIKDSVWLIFFKKSSSEPSIDYSEAVDDALCFGWVDSKPNKRDTRSYYRYFSKRNPKSNWSKINKEKVKRLIEEGKMTESGLKMIELAKETGTWDALNEVEDLIVPEDLQKAFDSNETAFKHWQSFPDSSKKIILEWIFNAKTEKTRTKRILETIKQATQNKRANHYRS